MKLIEQRNLGLVTSPTPSASRRTPIWRAIAAALRQDLAEGRYGRGDQLPTEAELAARFGVNRHTVRRGIAELAEEGLLRTRRGAGCFVAKRPTEYPLGERVRFHENLRAAGRHPEKRILLIDTRLATRAEAVALEVSEGAPVCACHGIALADGQPIALFESVFPAGRLKGIAAALAAQDSVTAALKAVGVADYTRASTRLTAVLADAVQAVSLEISEGDPLLRAAAVNVDLAGQPVEFGRTHFVGGRMTLTL